MSILFPLKFQGSAFSKQLQKKPTFVCAHKSLTFVSLNFKQQIISLRAH